VFAWNGKGDRFHAVGDFDTPDAHRISLIWERLRNLSFLPRGLVPVNRDSITDLGSIFNTKHNPPTLHHVGKKLDISNPL